MFTALSIATPRATLLTTMSRITRFEAPGRMSNFTLPPVKSVPPAARFVLPMIVMGDASDPDSRAVKIIAFVAA